MTLATKIVLNVFLFLLLTIAMPVSQISAQTIEDLRKSIDEHNVNIKKLEEDANKSREEISLRQRVGNTLRGEIQRIDNTLTQFRRDIIITENKIGKTELQIETLVLEIRDKEISLKKLRAGLSNLLNSVAIEEKEPPIEILTKYSFTSDFFRQIDYSAFVHNRILRSLNTLKLIREELIVGKAESQKKKDELENLRLSLNDRKKIQEYTKQERSDLLARTKNEEKKYQELLREQEKKRAALEDEIHDIEEKIRITIDPGSLPTKGHGVLGWPLPDLSLASCFGGIDSARNCITQFFGYTSFAAIGAYQGKGHNGADFRADTGTPVLASEIGTVEDTGNTDVGCRRASYGKWILLRHPNNLSTLYAHLSEISVYRGQPVTRGQIIGYSGKTGYATGPHLHFGLFATQAVRVESIRSRVCGRMMTLPIAAINGYLNPLDYL